MLMDLKLSNESVAENIDFTTQPFPKPYWIIVPNWQIGVKISTFIPFIILGIIGNFLLLNIIIRNRALQTPTNLLLANMASADLVTITIAPILFLYHDFYQMYPLGQIGCKMQGFIDGSLLLTAVFSLVAVSYDRLTAIVLPQETRLTVKGARIVMLLSWLFGILMAIPFPLHRTYKERQWLNILETYCWEDPLFLPMYWHVIISALVWFPLCVMVICYTAIFWKLDRYEKNVLKREHPISVSYKTKAAKILFIVVVVFIVLRIPFTAMIFVRNGLLKSSVMDQIDGSFRALWYTSHYLIFVNAAINPLLYGITNDNFRRAYHQTPWFPCQFQPKVEKRTKKLPSVKLNKTLQPRGPCADEQFFRPTFWQRFTITSKSDVGIVAGGTTTATQIKIISELDFGGKNIIKEQIVGNIFNVHV